MLLTWVSFQTSVCIKKSGNNYRAKTTISCTYTNTGSHHQFSMTSKSNLFPQHAEALGPCQFLLQFWFCRPAGPCSETYSGVFPKNQEPESLNRGPVIVAGSRDGNSLTVAESNISLWQLIYILCVAMAVLRMSLELLLSRKNAYICKYASKIIVCTGTYRLLYLYIVTSLYWCNFYKRLNTTIIQYQ